MKEYKKICKVCGKEFIVNDPRFKTCSEECQAENKRIHNRERFAKNSYQSRADRSLKRMENLTKDAIKAREAGDTYGHWKSINEVKIHKDGCRNCDLAIWDDAKGKYLCAMKNEHRYPWQTCGAFHGNEFYKELKYGKE